MGAFEAKNSISGTNPPLDYASFNLNENKKFLTLKIFSEELLVGLEVFTKKNWNNKDFRSVDSFSTAVITRFET